LNILIPFKYTDSVSHCWLVQVPRNFADEHTCFAVKSTPGLFRKRKLITMEDLDSQGEAGTAVKSTGHRPADPVRRPVGGLQAGYRQSTLTTSACGSSLAGRQILQTHKSNLEHPTALFNRRLDWFHSR
jgi:hypothetical protein